MPLEQRHYDLVMPQALLEADGLRERLARLHDAGLRAAVAARLEYDVRRIGEAINQA